MPDTIFDYIDSITCTKQFVDDIKYDESVYSGYMCNRWISMMDADSAMIINETTNRLWSQLPTKVEHYEFLLNLMPRKRKQRINYIKKIKETQSVVKADLVNVTQGVAQCMQISQREVKMYEELSSNI